MSYHWGIIGEEAGATSNDLVDSIVIEGTAYILEFGLLV